MEDLSAYAMVGIGALIFVFFCLAFFLVRCFRKVEQGQALIKNGIGGTKVTFSGMVVFPVIHRAEYMDISVKRIEIDRNGAEGLICKDNMRADIKVAFFVRVNKTVDDVLRVAQSVGCERASNKDAMVELFDAKFSEALKTVGKQFVFTELYNSRETFKDEILKIIGTDLNGFVLDDAAIDFLEQTNIEMLNENNILDSEGIKKIIELTSAQKVISNDIENQKKMTITKQNVEAEEAILALNKQLAEAEEQQKREIANIKSREEAETAVVAEKERLKQEQARIATEEEVQIAEENKNRQIIVAQKNKERTDAVESERVEKDRMLEVTEREKIVSLADIEKEKQIEVQKKDIQDVIRERVMVEKTVVEEQERIKDTEAFAKAEREKQVAITNAEQQAEEVLVKDIKAAEASKKANDLASEELLVTAEAKKNQAVKIADAKKAMAEGVVAEEAAKGLAEVKVKEQMADAIEREGEAEAKVLEASGLAEVRVKEQMAAAVEKEGEAEAKVMEMKFNSEATGIREKADAMKVLDGVGVEHEEFKLELEKKKEIEIHEIDSRMKIASEQAGVLAEALKTAKIDIVGGETQFFDKIVGSITGAKQVDRYVEHSDVLSDVKETFFNGDPEFFKSQFKNFFSQFGLSTEDVKNLSISAALNKLIGMSQDGESKTMLHGLLAMADRSGMGDQLVSSLGLKLGAGKKKA